MAAECRGAQQAPSQQGDSPQPPFLLCPTKRKPPGAQLGAPPTCPSLTPRYMSGAAHLTPPAAQSTMARLCQKLEWAAQHGPTRANHTTDDTTAARRTALRNVHVGPCVTPAAPGTLPRERAHATGQSSKARTYLGGAPQRAGTPGPLWDLPTLPGGQRPPPRRRLGQAPGPGAPRGGWGVRSVQGFRRCCRTPPRRAP
eukprot:scaffold12514_cov101-Isochrysis_galbana.AAC.3